MHDEFLCCQIRHCLRGGKAAWQQRRLFRCLHNVGLAGLLLAALAGVGVVYVLANPELRRLHLQRPAHILADLNQFAAAGRADPLILRQTVLHHLSASPLRNDVQHIAGLPLALVRLHSNRLLSGGFGSRGIGFLLVVSKTQLLHDHLLRLFRRTAKQLLLGQLQLLQQPLILQCQAGNDL